MDEVIKILDKIIEGEDKALAVKARAVNTVGSVAKVLIAAEAADLGDTERAVVSRASQIAQKLQALLS
jgi:hypothetical protein